MVWSRLISCPCAIHAVPALFRACFNLAKRWPAADICGSWELTHLDLAASGDLCLSPTNRGATRPNDVRMLSAFDV